MLLDAFLIFELYMRQHNEEVQTIDGPNSGIHNSFRMDTQVSATPPSGVTFLRGSRIDFNKQKNFLSLLASSARPVSQKIRLSSNGMQLDSTLKQPINSSSLEGADLQKNILGIIYQGQNYTYWQTDHKSGTVDFVQLYNGHPVFVSRRSNIPMLQFLIKDGNIISYQQSFFRFKQVNHVDIISSERALTNLAENTNIMEFYRPTVKTVELVYINLVGDSGSDPLIFMPAWHIVVHVNGHTEEYFVNAMSGNIQQLN
nr:two-component system regulatory protein YycI [Sporolactobacillus spathodeae]